MGLSPSIPKEKGEISFKYQGIYYNLHGTFDGGFFTGGKVILLDPQGSGLHLEGEFSAVSPRSRPIDFLLAFKKGKTVLFDGPRIHNGIWFNFSPQPMVRGIPLGEVGFTYDGYRYRGTTFETTDARYQPKWGQMVVLDGNIQTVDYFSDVFEGKSHLFLKDDLSLRFEPISGRRRRPFLVENGTFRRGELVAGERRMTEGEFETISIGTFRFIPIDLRSELDYGSVTLTRNGVVEIRATVLAGVAHPLSPEKGVKE